MSDEDEELSEVWARNLISKHIYTNDAEKQRQVAIVQRRLPAADQSLPWSDLEVLCAKTLCAILNSKKEASSRLYLGKRRSMNSTDAMFKKRMFFFPI
jgi:hypothetical protein